MNKKKKIWIGVISLVLALLLFMVLMVIQQSMQAKPESKCVLFAKEGIPQSVVLTEENIPNVIQIIYVLYNIHGRVCGSYESLLKKYEAINN
jgi:hypothetical protein